MKLVPVFLLFTTFLFAQTRPYYYPVGNFLNDHHIQAIEQDAFGRLIVGTDRGIYSFNGFQSKQLVASKLDSKDVIQLLELGKQLIGLTRTGQLFRLQGEHAVPLSLQQVKGGILRIEKDHRGNLRVLSASSVILFRPGSFAFVSKTDIPFYEKGQAELMDYAENEKGRFALLSSNELIDLDDQAARTLPGMTGRWLVGSSNRLIVFPAKPTSVNSLQYRDKRFKNLHKLIGGFNHSVQKVVCIDEKVYLLSETGMMVLKVGDMRVKSVIVGLHVTAVFKDNRQNTWFGTKSKGLYCMPAGSYKLVNSIEFSHLEKDPKGIRAVTNAGQIMLLNKFGKKVKDFVPEVPQIKQQNGVVWKGQVPNFLGDELVQEVIPLDLYHYLIRSSKGIFKQEIKNHKRFVEKIQDVKSWQPVFENPVKDFVRSDSSEVLFSSQDGLFTLNLQTLEYRQIRYFNENIDPEQILFHKGNWYVLSSANKIFTIRNGKVTHEVNLRENGGNLLVSKLKIYNDQFYLLSDKTLYKTKDMTGNLERLEELSRMNDLFLRDFVVLNDKVFVATQFGLFEFKWEKVKTDFPSFVLGTPVGDHQKSPGVFEADNTEIAIPYELVELMGNHPYQLQYRLVRDGEEEQAHWSNASLLLNKLTFEYLSSGSYNLQLRLFDPGTRRFSAPDTTAFKVKSAWYEDVLMWFITGVLIGFFGLLYLKRRKRLKKMELG